MFRRQTDDFIYQTLKKRPLDVGANMIARTAHAALEMLHRLRARTGQELSLAWSPGNWDGSGVIEVYPAATLIAHQVDVKGYKEKYGATRRKKILAALSNVIILPDDTALIENSPDVFDAVICALAGYDFLMGDVYPPVNIDMAQKEGWIWVKQVA